MCAGGVASIGEVMSGPRERCRGDVHRTQLTLARWQHAQAIHHACESIPVATTIDAPAGSYDTPSAPPMAFAWATANYNTGQQQRSSGGFRSLLPVAVPVTSGNQPADTTLPVATASGNQPAATIVPVATATAMPVAAQAVEMA